MPGHATLMPAAYFQLIVRELAVDDPQAGELACEGTGLAIRNTLGQIGVDQQLRQAESLNRSHPPGWGLKVGSIFDAAAHGTVGVAASTAPTIADTVGVLGRYGHLRTPFLSYRAFRSGFGMSLQISDSWGLPEQLRIPLVESTLVSITNLLQRLAGLNGRDLRAQVDYPAPGHSASYARHLRAPVTFSCAHSRLQVPRRWLGIRPSTADPELHRAAINLLEVMPSPAPRQHALIETINGLLAAADHIPLASVAAQLNLTPRTLERTLRQLGTTYREISEEHRRRLAHELLRNTALPIATIAERLGYSETANFGRACRRWFHTSPTRYRADAPASDLNDDRAGVT